MNFFARQAEMVMTKINKLEAARRQLNAAIRMTFSEQDVLAIHTVTAAGYRIIRDICERRGDIESYLRFTDWIAEGYEKKFWAFYNASSNFLKHADRDADEIHDFDEEQSDFMILSAAKWYRDLGNSPSHEMLVYATWWALQNPGHLKPDYLASVECAGYGPQFATLQRSMSIFNRKDRLRAGRLMLEAGAHRGDN